MTAVLAPPEPVVEFVDRGKAEFDAERAIDLLNASAEARTEAWLALAAVAGQVGPSSNVGVRYIAWTSRWGKTANYRIRVPCVEGTVEQYMHAPPTIEEALLPEHLAKAQAVLARISDENGGLRAITDFPKGTGPALVAAASASATGRAWLDDNKTGAGILLACARVGHWYGPLGIFPGAGLSAHQAFLRFNDRADLIREFPAYRSAWAKARSLDLGPGDRAGRPRAVQARVDLAISTRQVNAYSRRHSLPLSLVREMLISRKAGLDLDGLGFQNFLKDLRSEAGA